MVSVRKTNDIGWYFYLPFEHIFLIFMKYKGNVLEVISKTMFLKFLRNVS
jgi:hypothetical protein